MDTKRKSYIIVILLLVIFSNDLCAQQNYFENSKGKKNVDRKQTFASSLVFREIEGGLSGGSVSDISRFLGSQTYISLLNGASGYYSSNQAYYVLEDFFRIYKITSFRFQNIHADDNTPYATGVYKYYLGGRKDSANVYISLKKMGRDWKITQITID